MNKRREEWDKDLDGKGQARFLEFLSGEERFGFLIPGLLPRGLAVASGALGLTARCVSFQPRCLSPAVFHAVCVPHSSLARRTLGLRGPCPHQTREDTG